MTELVAYRHAAYDSPWWANPSSRSGRFHRALEHPTQYLSSHPLGPAAEVLRHHVGPSGDAGYETVVLNLWAVLLEDEDIVVVGFDNCADYGLQPEELVGDDYGPTQALADRMRNEGVSGIRVPSAALPGTDNLVLFGPRVLHPYLLPPVTLEEVRTGHLTDEARPPAEVRALVRWLGTEHVSLDEWQTTGTYSPLDDPMARRW
jgi:RES domain-containing protein